VKFILHLRQLRISVISRNFFLKAIKIEDKCSEVDKVWDINVGHGIGGKKWVSDNVTHLKTLQNKLEGNIRHIDLGQTCKPDATATKACEIELEIASDQAGNSAIAAVNDVIAIDIQVGFNQGEGREINFIAAELL
jgi:hypothetical protein